MSGKIAIISLTIIWLGIIFGSPYVYIASLLAIAFNVILLHRLGKRKSINSDELYESPEFRWLGIHTIAWPLSLMLYFFVLK